MVNQSYTDKPDTGRNYFPSTCHNIPKLLVGRNIEGTTGTQRQTVDVHYELLFPVDSRNVNA